MKKSFFGIFLTVLLLASCSSQVNGVLREGGSAELAIVASLEPRMSILVKSLNMIMGDPDSQQILDGPSISRSMSASPGVKSVNLKNTGPSSVEGTAVIAKVEDFLYLTNGTPFIVYSESSKNGKSTGRILISLDRETAPALIELLSGEAIDYLSALMAPAVIGEDMSKNEYLTLVGSIYGPGIASDISAAGISVSIDFPGPITQIRGGTADGAKAVFKIPLLDILVLETPQSWEVSW